MTSRCRLAKMEFIVSNDRIKESYHYSENGEIAGLNGQFYKILDVVNYICSDMMEPLSYLPWGLLAGGLFLVVEKARRKCFGRCTEAQAAGHRRLWVLFLCIVYSIVILNLTFFSREPGSRVGVTIEIFGTWGNTAMSHAFFIENILLFIPFGILFPYAFPPLRRLPFCMLEGFLFSVFLELMQFITGRGFCQLDDVLTNTVGAMIGWACYRIWEKRRERKMQKKTTYHSW